MLNKNTFWPFYRARGVFYVTTNPDPPFARGLPGQTTNRAQTTNIYGGLKWERTNGTIPPIMQQVSIFKLEIRILYFTYRKWKVCFSTVN